MSFAKRLTPSGRTMLAVLKQHHVPVTHALVARYLPAEGNLNDAHLLAAMLMAHYHVFANGNTTLVRAALQGIAQTAGHICHRGPTALALLQELVSPLSAYLTKQRPMPLKQLHEQAGDIAAMLYIAEASIADCRSHCTPLFSLEDFFDTLL